MKSILIHSILSLFTNKELEENLRRRKNIKK
jgi:hypothetical protein